MSTVSSMMLAELQCGNTPLHLAESGGQTTCVECLLSTPGIDVNIKNRVSWCNQFFIMLEHVYMYMYVLMNVFGRGCTCP